MAAAAAGKGATTEPGQEGWKIHHLLGRRLYQVCEQQDKGRGWASGGWARWAERRDMRGDGSPGNLKCSGHQTLLPSQGLPENMGITKATWSNRSEFREGRVAVHLDLVVHFGELGLRPGCGGLEDVLLDRGDLLLLFMDSLGVVLSRLFVVLDDRLLVLLFFFIGVLAIHPPDYSIPNSGDDFHDQKYFKLPVIALVMITILNDGTIISIAYDNTHASKVPEKWHLDVSMRC